MKRYQVFASEGGYRFAGAIWAGGPIIDRSPWFPSREAAQKAAKKAKAKEAARVKSERQQLGID